MANDPEFRRRYRFVLRRNHRFNWQAPSSYVLHLYERVPDGAPTPR